MKIVKSLLLLFVFSMLLLAKENDYKVNGQISLQSNNNRPVVIESSNQNFIPQSREEIDLFVSDFEDGTSGWSLDSGWQLVDGEYGASATHSINSPNDASTYDGSWNALSPIWSLPVLGDGETMNFSFWIYGDMPDTDGDGDNYLEDYYSVSLMDIDALAWHPSSNNSYDGNSYWCGDEEVGGYLDSWIQFLDTPSFTVPGGAQLTADMMWTIEDPAGASVAGTCTDGWDAANVQISVDGGENWELLNGSDPYDFDCGYGWIWNSDEYDTGGSLNHLAAGWGGNADWHNVSFNLSSYAGQEAIVRFAFGSDPAYCTLDDGGITGLRVDNVTVSGSLDCHPENDCDVTASGAVWVDQFYDYVDADRPGYSGWEPYLAGYPFNGNVFMDISDFAGKDVTFRVASRYDADSDGGSGSGLFIDDFRVYKISGGSYPPPYGLEGEGLDESVDLWWSDLNASGTEDFVYHNNSFTNGITMTEGTAWAGERIDLAGTSTINSIEVCNDATNTDSDVPVAVFGQFGSLFGNEAVYETTVNVAPGSCGSVDVSWSMTNSYIIAHQFSDVFTAGLDESAAGTGHSMVMLNAGWDSWSDVASGAGLPDGEWGIGANITFDGAGVTYNVYQDGVQVQSGVSDNSTTVTGLENNTSYLFSVSATYGDGEESLETDQIELTPQAQTTHEEYHDDGSAESFFNAGSSNFTAVRYEAQDSGEAVVRFKWFQEGDGGAFYIKLFDDDNGQPGAEVESLVCAGGLVAGWNTKDLLSNDWNVSGDFWIGTKEFSSTQPVGLDESGSGNSVTRVGSGGAWTDVAGNLMMRVYLDCGDDCEGGGDECTAGDVNSDGIINVLDIVAAVNFVLGTGTPDDQEACASDYNGDGIINVLDIVAIVNVVLGGGA